MKVLKKIKTFHILIILVCGIIIMAKGAPLYGDDYVKVWESESAIAGPVYDVEVGDIDGDGMPEIIAADFSLSGSAKVYVFENNGDDSYQLVWDSGNILSMFFCFIEVGDQDKDGKLEIIAVELRHEPPFNGKIHVFENNGDNTYEEVWNNGNAFNGIQPSALFLGDADNDGKREIIIGTDYQSGDRKIRIYENIGDNAYQETWNSGSMLSDTVREGAVGDTDKDGKKEIIIGFGGIDSRVYVFENNGDNSFEGPVWNSGSTFTKGGCVSIGDQDGDGEPEIIASGGRDRIVHVFENSGDNSYTNVWNSGTLNSYPARAAIGDQDQDGNRELIIPCADGKVYVFENTGDNNYEEVWNSGSVMSGYIYDAAVGDQDADGKKEIIAASYSGKVYVFENPGPPTITIEIDIKPGSWPNAVNPRSKGVIPVAILTTNKAVGESVDFDATAVDPLSVKFGPGEAVEAHGKGHIKDVDSDGDLDMVLHFKTPETSIQYGDTEACLTGKTLDGKSIEACDAIVTVGKGKK
ncbi:MAG: VCBS repeat-containing protein [Candidatus Aminicenantes bacterium]|jgi:hypothetical protein